MKWADCACRVDAGVSARHRLPVLATAARASLASPFPCVASRAVIPGEGKLLASPLWREVGKLHASPTIPCIGPHPITPNVILAPMAGVTDKPFRQLCKRLGAGLAVSEMTIADPRFWNTAKSLRRMDHDGEPDAGQRADRRHRAAQMLAEAARHNVDHGAQIDRHQHGLPGEEGVQRLGRLGADARRGAGRADPRRRGGARSTCR